MKMSIVYSDVVWIYMYLQFIHTLESQRTFSPRDRAYVASLLTVALHEKLEYFTDILKTLLSHLVEQYTTRNPKLMLRRSVLSILIWNQAEYVFLQTNKHLNIYYLILLAPKKHYVSHIFCSKKKWYRLSL